MSRIQELEEKLIIIGMRERCLELTQELATVKERAEKAEARVKELEAIMEKDGCICGVYMKEQEQ